jgi:tetratricopeptide (TPR) repeat protein
MLRLALALCGAGLLLAGCQAQAEVQSPEPSAGIPELISRCLDGRDIAGPVATCTLAVDARVGSNDLLALAHYSLDMAGRGSIAPRGIPGPILPCLYTFDVEGRLASCTRAIESDAGSAEMQALAYHARAIAHCRDGHPERSVIDESKAIALVSNFPAAYAHRAECKLALGDVNGARADQAEAIRLAPDVAGYYRQAAMMANLAGDHDAALKYLDHAIGRWPQFNEVFDLRAKTLFNMRRYDEAAEAFAQTVKMFPGDEFPVLWLHLARMNAGQPDAAEFAANTAELRLSGWTKSMFDYYRGRGDYAAALQASRSSDDSDAECVASLLIGEHMLAKREPLAGAFIGAAASTCDPRTAPTSFLAARAEMKKLSPPAWRQGSAPLTTRP